MSRLANITKFPHATGEAKVEPVRGNLADEVLVAKHLKAHDLAMMDAVANFRRLYDRWPTWDILNHRGCHTTVTVIVEIWEEG